MCGWTWVGVALAAGLFAGVSAGAGPLGAPAPGGKEVRRAATLSLAVFTSGP
jgi:hypothetical protein